MHGYVELRAEWSEPARFRQTVRRSAHGHAVGYAGFGRARRARARVNKLCATTEHQE
jgi:hypothetical protein